MINKLGNNGLTMYEGDTGTISFKIIGYEEGDKYLFAIVKYYENNDSYMTIKAYR